MAQREFQNSQQARLKILEITNGNYSDVPNPRAFINSILPEDMAEYFFFHGEGVSNINSNKSGEKFRRAIRDILGFHLAETAVEDLRSIHKDWTKELSGLQNLSKEQSDLINKKMNHEAKIEKLVSDISNLNLEKESYGKDLEEVQNKLRTCSSSDAQKLQREIDVLTRKSNELSGKIRECKIERQLLIRDYGGIIFGQNLANQALDFIDIQSSKATIPAPYDESLVNDLIEQKHCICGRDLIFGTPEYVKVKGLLEKADNKDIRDKVKKSESTGNFIKNRFMDFFAAIKKIDVRLKELDDDKRDNEHQLSEATKALKEIDIEEVKNLEDLKSACAKKLELCNQDIGGKNRTLETLKNELNTYESRLRAFGSQDIRINRLSNHQKFVADLIKLCEDKLDQYERNSIITIASIVNQTLQTFSRKDFKVKVSDDFSFYLVREDGKRVAKSKGENLLLNLSFVSALIEFAGLRRSASSDLFVSGTTAPFVIDAPFGELDNTYKKATAEFLPQRSRQLIFLLSSSHWSGAVDETIKDKVGAEYVLISSKITTQNERPEDKLIINGEEYIQSLYNQDKDATFIVKVR